MVSVDPKNGKTWVFFGTGRYLNLADLTNKDTQSWYDIIDPMSSTAGTLSRGDLEAVSILDEVDIPNLPGFKARVIDERSEEHTSELQSLMRISYAVFCLKKKTKIN